MAGELELDLDGSASRVRDQWGIPHDLRLRFSYQPEGDAPSTDRPLAGQVHIAQERLQLVYCFGCYGWDLVQFTSELEALHVALEGEARFVSQDGTVEICLAVADRGRGRISVLARLEQLSVCVFTELPMRGWLEFAGFGIDQSSIPGMVKEIQAFLRSHGISTTHPMKPCSPGR